MHDTAILIAQTAAIAFLAGWMFTGVKDNWLQPRINSEIVGMILRMDRFEELYPDQFAHVRHRRVVAVRTHMTIFWLIVLWETAALIACLAGTALMLAALFGDADPDLARGVALVGATWFASVWAGFLIFGNHWVYWYCHEWGQNSHFQLLLWGLGTMVLLAV